MTNSTSNERPAYVWVKAYHGDHDVGSLFKHAVAFELLIERLRKTHPGTAEWIDTVLRHAPGFIPCGNVDYLLEWSLSPQGHEFWIKLHDLLEDEGFCTIAKHNHPSCFRP